MHAVVVPLGRTVLDTLVTKGMDAQTVLASTTYVSRMPIAGKVAIQEHVRRGTSAKPLQGNPTTTSTEQEHLVVLHASRMHIVQADSVPTS